MGGFLHTCDGGFITRSCWLSSCWGPNNDLHLLSILVFHEETFIIPVQNHDCRYSRDDDPDWFRNLQPVAGCLIDLLQEKVPARKYGPDRWPHFWSIPQYARLHPKYFDYTIATLAVPGSAPNIDYHFYEYAMRKCEPRFVIFDLSVGYLRKFNDRSWIEGRKLPYYFGNFAGGIWSHFLSRYPLKEHFGAEEQEKYDRWGQPVEISAKKDIFARLSYRDSLILQHSKTTYTFEKQQLPKDPKRLRSNTGLYRKIIEECTARGIKVVFVSPPKYHLYNSGINQDYEYERTAFLQDIVDNDYVYFLNYENALEKQSRLFYNVNHLNQEGAGIFSKELNEVLKKIMDGRHVKSLSGAINIPPASSIITAAPATATSLLLLIQTIIKRQRELPRPPLEAIGRVKIVAKGDGAPDPGVEHVATTQGEGGLLTHDILADPEVQ